MSLMTNYTAERLALTTTQEPQPAEPTEQTKPDENGENGGNEAAAADSLVLARAPVTNLRQRLREDAELNYDTVFGKLMEAVNADRRIEYKCQACRVPNMVVVPDVKARTQAIQVLIEQGYGKPAQTVTVQEDTLGGLSQLHRWLELMTVDERAVIKAFVERMVAQGASV